MTLASTQKKQKTKMYQFLLSRPKMAITSIPKVNRKWFTRLIEEVFACPTDGEVLQQLPRIILE